MLLLTLLFANFAEVKGKAQANNLKKTCEETPAKLVVNNKQGFALEILDAGINVISPVNIQHVESLNEEIKDITGVEVKERIPDSVLGAADEVVNIDLTAADHIFHLRELGLNILRRLHAKVRTKLHLMSNGI